MARILIRQAHGGATRIISDPALPYFLNQGYVVLDTLDDETDASPLYLSAAESDMRYAKISDLGDPESAEVAVISEAVADSEALRAASVAAGQGVFAPLGDLRAFGVHLPHNYAPGGATVGTGNAAADTAAVLAAIDAANGETVYLPEGDYRVALSLTDQPVRLAGPGHLIQQQATDVIAVRRTLGPARTVTGISTVTLGNAAASPPSGETATRLDVSGTVADLRQGDVLHLSSQDPYPWTTTAPFTYKAGIVPLHGLGLAHTGPVNGGFAEGDTVTGATSGATGIARNTTVSGVNHVVFSSVTGAFVDGENLQVGGVTRAVASGGLYLVMAGRLIDTYTASPVVRLMPAVPLELDVTIRADGDPDTRVGSANRGVAIRLEGVVGAKVKAHLRSAWGRGVQLSGCYRADIDATVDRLPNDANLIEAAYGYGAELWGATEGCRVKVHATNVRHAFTTNTVTNSSYAFADPIRTGVPKWNTVHDSLAVDTIGAGFDTHQGAYYTTFNNCRVSNVLGGGRYLTAVAGFQNRAFGTTYRDCVAENAVIGFADYGPLFASSIPFATRYIDCLSINYQVSGFRLSSSVADDNSQVDMVNCEAVGDGSATSTPYYQQGFDLGSVPVTLTGCVSKRFNGAPFAVTGGTRSRVTAINCVADYRQAASGVTGFRLNGTVAQFDLVGYLIRLNPAAPTTPTGVVRNAAGENTVNTDGALTLGGAARPLTQVSAGSLAINVLTKTTA